MKKQGLFSAATVGTGSMPPDAGSTIAIEVRIFSSRHDAELSEEVGCDFLDPLVRTVGTAVV